MTELGHFIDFGSLNTQKKIYSSVGASVFYVKFVSSSSLSATRQACLFASRAVASFFLPTLQDRDSPTF